MSMQSALALIYPPHCATCEAPVSDRGGICGDCWRDTPFILGLCCDVCGMPLPGEDDETWLCDDCLKWGRPWLRGRAALVYEGRARQLVLRIKHGDRLDLVPAAAGWMMRAAAPLLLPETLLVPVPIHWRRLFRRRYNQAAALSREMARIGGCDHAPRALLRPRPTRVQDGKSAAERFSDLEDAIEPHPRYGAAIEGRPVLLVDDVMTSGATLSACTEACYRAGAGKVDVVTLARVMRGT
ncbi:ComF family protein [Palleronia sp. LCG004]|uniref:ComF family protein n=1 Tax=Palleronia sp. LCG004 TaxID=3079304 RepID=UPI0029423BD1|nr:ComF family protein [Palleronia sp. LCG004]WOI55973.1 ComF family protein [Palleronia sp. LCG004]